MYEHEVSMIFCSLEAVNRAFSRHFNIFWMTDRQTDRPTNRWTELIALPALRMHSHGVNMHAYCTP